MSKSTKKIGKMEKFKEKETLPSMLEDEDRTTLKIAMLERNNAQLVFQNLQQQLQPAQAQVQETQKSFENALVVINEKYGLIPKTDQVDVNTGVITRE